MKEFLFWSTDDLINYLFRVVRFLLIKQLRDAYSKCSKCNDKRYFPESVNGYHLVDLYHKLNIEDISNYIERDSGFNRVSGLDWDIYQTNNEILSSDVIEEFLKDTDTRAEVFEYIIDIFKKNNVNICFKSGRD